MTSRCGHSIHLESTSESTQAINAMEPQCRSWVPLIHCRVEADESCSCYLCRMDIKKESIEKKSYYYKPKKGKSRLLEWAKGERPCIHFVV